MSPLPHSYVAALPHAKREFREEVLRILTSRQRALGARGAAYLDRAVDSLAVRTQPKDKPKRRVVCPPIQAKKRFHTKVASAPEEVAAVMIERGLTRSAVEPDSDDSAATAVRESKGVSMSIHDLAACLRAGVISAGDKPSARYFVALVHLATADVSSAAGAHEALGSFVQTVTGRSADSGDAAKSALLLLGASRFFFEQASPLVASCVRVAHAQYQRCLELTGRA